MFHYLSIGQVGDNGVQKDCDLLLGTNISGLNYRPVLFKLLDKGKESILGNPELLVEAMLISTVDELNKPFFAHQD